MEDKVLRGNTLPELLVTMLLSGLLLLLVFDGVDMLRQAAGWSASSGRGEELHRLEQYEMLKERSDSMAVGDSVRFYRHGQLIGTCRKWN